MTLFDRLGGEAAINAAVDVFYKKVLEDNRINYFFAESDMNEQSQKQKHFFAMATGGPNSYTGKGLRKGHKHLVEQGLNDTHYDIVVEHLGNTLKEFGVQDAEIAEVAALANSVRDDVLNR